MSVKLIETWGSEEGIVEAARMSTGKGFLGWGTPETPGDEKLLKYLYRNKHMTPFEMAGATFEVEAPIFVAREWMRHRTLSYNEMSSRYIEIPDDHHIPSAVRSQSKTNKQGSGGLVSPQVATEFLEGLECHFEIAQQYYTKAIEAGVAREQARYHLPVARMTRFRVTGNLRNWLQFLTLRTDPAAQAEIREEAETVWILLSEVFPRVIHLWRTDTEIRKLTEEMWTVVGRLVNGDVTNPVIFRSKELKDLFDRYTTLKG
jgi:thymidylate synthase (FAD)